MKKPKSFRPGFYPKVNKSRPNSDDPRYHTKQWRATRKVILDREFKICQRCKREEANVCDHIKPAKIYTGSFFDLTNLQALCVSCHAIKSNEDKKNYD